MLKFIGVMVAYVALTALLAWLGFKFGNMVIKALTPMIGALAGIAVGVGASVLLWFFVGQKMVKK